MKSGARDSKTLRPPGNLPPGKVPQSSHRKEAEYDCQRRNIG